MQRLSPSKWRLLLRPRYGGGPPQLCSPVFSYLYLSEERACPELCRRVGAIPIAKGEVQRQHTCDAYSCTQAFVVCLRETGTNAADDPSKTPASCRSTIRATLDDALRRADSRG